MMISVMKDSIQLSILLSVISTLLAQPPDTVWTRTYTYCEFGYEAQQTNDNGYVIFADAFVPPSYHRDMVIIKTDTNGDTLWTGYYGGMSGELGSSGQQTIDGGYVALGITISFGLGEADFYLVKTDAFGDTIWTRTFGTVGDEWACRVRQTTDDGYVLVGRTRSVDNNYNAYVVRTNVNGDTLWTRTIGLPGSYERFNSVVPTENGGYGHAADRYVRPAELEVQMGAFQGRTRTKLPFRTC